MFERSVQILERLFPRLGGATNTQHSINTILVAKSMIEATVMTVLPESDDSSVANSAYLDAFAKIALQDQYPQRNLGFVYSSDSRAGKRERELREKYQNQVEETEAAFTPSECTKIREQLKRLSNELGPLESILRRELELANIRDQPDLDLETIRDKSYVKYGYPLGCLYSMGLYITINGLAALLLGLAFESESIGSDEFWRFLVLLVASATLLAIGVGLYQWNQHSKHKKAVKRGGSLAESFLQHYYHRLTFNREAQRLVDE